MFRCCCCCCWLLVVEACRITCSSFYPLRVSLTLHLSSLLLDTPPTRLKESSSHVNTTIQPRSPVSSESASTSKALSLNRTHSFHSSHNTTAHHSQATPHTPPPCRTPCLTPVVQPLVVFVVGVMDEIEKRKTARANVVKELIATERDYVTDLEVISQVRSCTTVSSNNQHIT
jgi:hypothetical protein